MRSKALVIVDVQQAFEDNKWGNRNNILAEDNIRKILSLWRNTENPVIYIQHQSDDPNSLFHPENKGFGIKDIVRPKKGEPIFTKKVNSGFIGTNLEAYLHEKNITDVVITGLTTAHCVSTTTRMSGNLGFNTFLISDAIATYGLTDQNGTYHNAEQIHELTLATLHDEFATILSTEELIKEFKLEKRFSENVTRNT
ncbi:cysteine hydrolase family protein [Pseudalkalibacillus hwajinpoensis]|uniref:Cysteine hydrolase n=1 Tax=Guptibacillus hwajinpoensis TaxID=208199 RepID=A0A4V6WS19_9BACL|nr:cysteine hydrolase family protein [Pseudalkalibacillus hwajinpoensis]TKD72328.1 cysteine hydrolase [Pseudalkalibacillus hwajinpoensis]